MTIQEVYQAVGGDYSEVMERLISDKIVRKYLLRFAQSASIEALETAFDLQDDTKAFHEAHALKGMALTLGLGNLATSSSALTEALRNGRTPEAAPLMETCKKDFHEAMEALQQLS